MDMDSCWSTEDQWGLRTPQGGGLRCGDPVSGCTEDNVYGCNPAGDYANNMPAYYLTAMVLDCCWYKNTKLKFRHWLDIGPNSGALNAGDSNIVEVCLNDAAGIEQ